jgi:hypothetical protein
MSGLQIVLIVVSCMTIIAFFHAMHNSVDSEVRIGLNFLNKPFFLFGVNTRRIIHDEEGEMEDVVEIGLILFSLEVSFYKDLEG